MQISYPNGTEVPIQHIGTQRLPESFAFVDKGQKQYGHQKQRQTDNYRTARATKKIVSITTILGYWLTRRTIEYIENFFNTYLTAIIKICQLLGH